MSLFKHSDLIDNTNLSAKAVQVWTPCRQTHRLNTTASEKCSKVGCEERISIHDELGLAGKKTVLTIEQIARNLLHPSAGRLMRDAADFDAAACQVDDNENVVANKTSQCEHLHREEVACCYGASVGSQKVVPRHLFLADRSRLNALLFQDSLNSDSSYLMPSVLKTPLNRVYPQLGLSMAMDTTRL